MRIVFSIILMFSYFANAAETKNDNELEQQLTEILMLADQHSDHEDYEIAFEHYENAIELKQSLPGDLHFFVFFKASYAAYKCQYFNEAAALFAEMIQGVYSQQQLADLTVMDYIKNITPPHFLESIWTVFDAQNQHGQWDFELVWIERIQCDPMIFN